MNTKTIAVDARVYDRLAAVKREGESFSKTIDRILAQADTAHTGSDLLRRLADTPPLPTADAEVFLKVVAENRASERWQERDLP